LQEIDLRCVAVRLWVGDVVACERRDEDGADAHWPEPSAEERLAERLDVGDPLVESEDNWQAAEEEDEDSDDHKAPRREAEVVEVLKGDDGTNVDEGGAVEQQVDDVGKHRVFRGFVEVSVPRERAPARESREQVVRTE
jgi:hypothetical protein